MKFCVLHFTSNNILKGDVYFDEYIYCAIDNEPLSSTKTWIMIKTFKNKKSHPGEYISIHLCQLMAQNSNGNIFFLNKFDI